MRQFVVLRCRPASLDLVSRDGAQFDGLCQPLWRSMPASSLAFGRTRALVRFIASATASGAIALAMIASFAGQLMTSSSRRRDGFANLYANVLERRVDVGDDRTPCEAGLTDSRRGG